MIAADTSTWIAFLQGDGVLGDSNAARNFWLIPLRDLFGFAVWLAGSFGSRVAWRDRVLQLRPDGRIEP